MSICVGAKAIAVHIVHKVKIEGSCRGLIPAALLSICESLFEHYVLEASLAFCMCCLIKLKPLNCRVCWFLQAQLFITRRPYHEVLRSCLLVRDCRQHNRTTCITQQLIEVQSLPHQHPSFPDAANPASSEMKQSAPPANLLAASQWCSLVSCGA